jgi:hypothetical protein
MSSRTGATTVFVENHESHAVDVQLRWVGEGSSGSPGLRLCGNQRLAANSLTQLRFDAACGLSSQDERGMAVVLATTPSGLVRLSARGVIALLGGGSIVIDGLPLASLESTDVVHVVNDLSSDPTGATAPAFTTDCLFGMLFDGSGAGGSIVRFGLRDGDGQPIGKDVLTAVKPFSLERFRDVFSLVGAPAQPFENVRAIFAPAGGGDSALGYCVATARTSLPQGQTLVYTLAQVDEPLEQTRRRSISVMSTPEVQRGARFRLDPAESEVVHGLFVRHPDRFSCGVQASDELFLALIPPDGAARIGGASGLTGWFDTGPRSTVNDGISGLWALEVSWGTGALRNRPVDYALSCRSGNGMSLADELVRMP